MNATTGKIQRTCSVSCVAALNMRNKNVSLEDHKAYILLLVSATLKDASSRNIIET
jgi:hypothetical protein